MVLITEPTISSLGIKFDLDHRDDGASIDSTSLRGSPPPPYLVLNANAATPTHDHFAFQTTPPADMHPQTATSTDEPDMHHHSHGRWGHGCGRRRGGRRCAREMGRRGGWDRQRRLLFFRHFIARFFTFLALTLLWLHAGQVKEGVQAGLASLPSSVTDVFSAIGHLLYLPIAVSQTFGILFYCAFAAAWLTIIHSKVHRHRLMRWQARWTEAMRARHARVHDHEAWPDHHHHHHLPAHPLHHQQQAVFCPSDSQSALTAHAKPACLHGMEIDASSSTHSSDLDEEKSVSDAH